MPLPTRIDYVDRGKIVQQVEVPSAPPPATGPDYHPTHVPIRCKGCMTVGLCEFVGGFDVKKGDALMQGKVIKGWCFTCGKEQELIPLPHLTESDRKGLKLIYDIQRSAELYAQRGWATDGSLWPRARIEAYERWLAENGIAPRGPDGGAPDAPRIIPARA